MAQGVLSVYITEEEIKVCGVKKGRKNIQVSRAFTVDTPKGSVDGGTIVAVEEVAEALRKAFSANGIKKGRLCFTIASKKIANKEVTVPYVKNKSKVAEMIEANLEEFFPMGSLEDYIYRHVITDTVRTQEGRTYVVSVTAVKKDLVMSYYELIKELNMPVESVDYYGNSIYNIICRQMEDGVTLALQMDADMTHVSIMRGQTQLFRRTVPHGRTAMIETFAEYRGLAPKEAENILTDAARVDQELTFADYQEMISDLVGSIARVMEYYVSKNPGIKVDRAAFFGEGLDLNGLPEALGRELEIEMTAKRELKSVVLKRKNKYGVTMKELSCYLPNIGAVIAPLDLRVEEEKKHAGLTQVLAGAAAVAAVAIIGLCVYTGVQNYRLREEKARLDAENEKQQGVEAAYLAYLGAKEECDWLTQYREAAQNDSEAAYLLFVTLERVMPESVGISNIGIESGNVSLTGVSNGKVPLAGFVAELKKLSFVSDVRLAKALDVNDGTRSEFEMSFHIRIPEPAENEQDEGGMQE